MGFGINTPEQASDVAKASDGVVVGSAIVNQIAQNANNPDIAKVVTEFVTPLIQASKVN